jgi:glucose-6-phosphate isomerase
MKKLVSVDLNLMFAPAVKNGLVADAYRAMTKAASAAVDDVNSLVAKGTLGFVGLPDDEALAAKAIALGTRLRARFDTFVVLGIGGSSLGGRCLMRALAPDARVIFLDNVDPDGFLLALDRLDLDKTVFNVISKSGGTVETAAQFCVVRDRLKRAFGEAGYRERMVATTDPSEGLMRKIADAEGLETLSVPQNVGGRFSVLSAVGLLPAAFAGVDVRALLAGARSMRERTRNKDLAKNPALAIAASHVLAMKSGRPIHVMMPYRDALRPFSEWYAQLWGESLGKALSRAGEHIHVGPTPVAALGTTDQHSQVQLYIEGPHDKVVTFLAVKEGARTLAFPGDVPEGYAYLRGHTMEALLDAEQRGTALALAREGRPSLTVTLPSLDAHSLGELFFLYEAATAFAGSLLGIDAFDQPGVELGKKIAFALMGRKGFEAAIAGMDDLAKGSPEWRFEG